MIHLQPAGVTILSRDEQSLHVPADIKTPRSFMCPCARSKAAVGLKFDTPLVNPDAPIQVPARCNDVPAIHIVIDLRVGRDTAIPLLAQFIKRGPTSCFQI